jgi:tricorn protease
VIGINMSRMLVDGGIVTYPYSAWWDRLGGWSIENHGVDPDIEVENPPQDVAAGKDDQLERGLAELTRLHEENPPAKPDFGPVKSKSRSAYRREG